MNLLPDLGREAAAVGDLHHQPVGRRQPHMDVDLRAEIGHEFHRAGVVVVESQGLRPDLQPLRPQRQRRLAGGAPGNRQAEAAVGPEPAVLDRAGEEGRAADEARDEARGRPLVEVALRADLLDRALVHHHQPVGHGERLFLVVGHHHRGQAELLLQFADLDPHLLAQLGVEVGERLVEQQDVGPDGERAGERHALLLAARELARQARAEAREPDQRQRLLDAFFDVGLRQFAHLQAKGDVLRHGEVGEQRVALEDHAGVALPRRQQGDVAAAELHLARGRLDEARDHAQGRGLAAARGAEQHQEFAIGDRQRDVLDRMEVAVALDQSVDVEARHQTTRASLT